MALDVEKHVAYWRSGADEALAAAEILTGNCRYSFGLFFMHLALEKMLKALVTQRSADMPPRTHDLLFLARCARLSPPPNLSVILGEFQGYCMAGRYPDAEPATVDRELAEAELTRTKEAYEWLRQQFNK